MDGLTLKAAASLARETWGGRLVTGARWVSPAGLLLSFGGRLPGLVLAVHPSLYGLYPAAGSAPAKAAAPGSFEAAMRGIRGRTLKAVGMEGLERVVRLTLARKSPAGREEEVTLVLEAMSRWSNLVLLDAAGRVMAAAKLVPPLEAGRVVLPGQPYRPPAPDARPDPSLASAGELEPFFRQASVAPGKGGEEGRPVGFSRATWEDFLALARGRGLDPAGSAALLAGIAARPPGRGRLSAGADGRPRLYLDLGGEGGEGTGLLEAAGDFYRAAARGIVVGEKAGEILRRLRGERRRRLALAEKLTAEAAEAARAGEYREMGSLLLAHLREMRKGDAVWTSRRAFGQEGLEASVPLDPRLSPRENAERYFTRARKLEAGRAVAEGRLADNAAWLKRAESLAGEVELAEDPAALASLAERARLLTRRGGAGPRPAPPPRPDERPKRRYMEYVSSGGRLILVGKDAASNDYLLSRKASPEDIWCHAQGFAGAHVILKAAGDRGEPPEADVEEACMLAAWHSGARGEKTAAVSCARRKHVRKPKGAAPGLVLLGRHRTLSVRPAVPPGVRQKPG